MRRCTTFTIAARWRCWCAPSVTCRAISTCSSTIPSSTRPPDRGALEPPAESGHYNSGLMVSESKVAKDHRLLDGRAVRDRILGEVAERVRHAEASHGPLG